MRWWPFKKKTDAEQVIKAAEELAAKAREARRRQAAMQATHTRSGNPLRDPVPALTPVPFTLKPVELQGETTRSLNIALDKLEKGAEQHLATLRERTQETQEEAQAARTEAEETSDTIKGKR